jgi:hypothetical protein
MSAPAPQTAEPTRRLGTRQHYRWLEGIVKVTLVLNLVDAVFTLAWVGLGLASEANPFLAELVTAHPILFVSTKLGLVGLGSLLLWRLRHRPLAVIAMFVAFLVYYGILLMHVDYLGYVIGILLSS